MTTPRSTADFLEDIRAAAKKAQSFVTGMTFHAFSADEKTAFAVVRALEIIGEAAKRIPGEIRLEHPSLPWRSMCGIRDKLIHDYTSVDLEIVWKAVHEDLPELLEKIDIVIRTVNRNP